LTLGRSRNEVWARALAEEFARCGVREIVVAPGSRSTPLVLAFAAEPAFRLHVEIDERSAGFLALGLGRGSGVPAIVLTTSGTATANLFPAVIEASQSEVPLLVLTADRPHHLRDADANQAIDQLRLFGPFVRAFHEVSPPVVTDAALRHLRALAARSVATALGGAAGPVHLNLPFDKPLEPVAGASDAQPGFEATAPEAWRGRGDLTPFVRISRRRSAVDPDEVHEVAQRIAAADRPLLVAGPAVEARRSGPALIRVAPALGVPVLADPLSGARFGAPADAAIGAGYDVFLRDPELRGLLRPDLIVRVGSSPTSAILLGALDEWGDVPQIVIDAGARWKDHLARAHRYVVADPAGFLTHLGVTSSASDPLRPARREWVGLWQQAFQAAAEGADAALGRDFIEAVAVAEGVSALGEEGVLFVSSSMPIRDLDAFVPAGPQSLDLHANRGASGIDGIVSTVLGVRLATGGRMVALLGDLALLHDMNGLLALRNAHPDLVLLVIQNDGGGIFHHLPIRDFEPPFTRLFATPHGLELSRVAALYDLSYRLLTPTREGVAQGVAAALTAGGPHLLEVRTDREENRVRRTAAIDFIRAHVREALRSGSPPRNPTSAGGSPVGTLESGGKDGAA
jgi:2-succinyl-5-enolpyruvyl-6-hydroxy-3-cyclohexene-1-carboxylate synthase